MQQIK